MPTVNGNNSANTIIRVGNVNETINARGGNDIVYAGGGADTVDGGGGHDRLYGEDGDDILLGGAGNDSLDGGAGNDVLNGGIGIDWALFSGGAAVVVDLRSGTAIGEGSDTLQSIENVLGSSFNDVIRGSAGANTMDGGDGADRFVLGTGAASAVVADFGANGNADVVDLPAFGFDSAGQST